jgi:UDP-N-acetylmuramoyl-L-alanyl-D-glutamate--2,6-diaminopimelate ligase
VPEFAFLVPRHPLGTTVGSLTSGHVRLASGSADTVITNVAVNGVELQQQGLFAALPGRNSHGADFAEQAIAAGAVAILTDEAGLAVLARLDLSADPVPSGHPAAPPSSAVPILVAEDPRAVLGDVAARVYGTDRQHPLLFGVTGTNGKTSTVHILDAILEKLGIPAGRSSTFDRRSGATTVASRLTSPEAPELHALLARMNEDGVQAAALEVSAQALSHHRVDGYVFDAVGFTNLSHDHMDEYGFMTAYLDAKLRLFTPEHARRGVVLLDDAAGAEIRDRASIPVTTVTSLPGVDADWVVEVQESTPEFTRFALTGPGSDPGSNAGAGAGARASAGAGAGASAVQRSLVCSVSLIGRHMAADTALAIVMLVEAGVDFARIAAALAEGLDVTIPGRTHLVSGADGPLVYTDFSHTPDSVEKTLAALRVLTPGQLTVIIGADGEKDSTKRGPMGLAAARGADVVIVTDHHQRFEDPAAIRLALLTGARQVAHNRILEVPVPSDAIRTAIRMSGTGDTILWVGPGRSDYRIVRGEDVPYSSRKDARVALTEAGWK